MGNATWSASEYSARRSTYRKKSRQELFSQSQIRKDFNPKNIVVRESCDSEANPTSNAIIVALDVTGSMGFIAEHIAKNGLGTLVEGILDRKPVADPHIMMMAIGDLFYDRAPLQATQFEADIRIAEQLTGLWLEGGGGGNSFESYDLPWAFAARKTKIDCFDKRGKKGYLFTIGDENPPEAGTHQQLSKATGIHTQTNLTAKALLSEAQERYNVFHIIVEEGSHARRHLREVSRGWHGLLGKRAVHLNNYQCIAEVIISVIEVNEGRDPDEVIQSWQNAEAKEAVTYALYGGAQ